MDANPEVESVESASFLFCEDHPRHFYLQNAIITNALFIRGNDCAGYVFPAASHNNNNRERYAFRYITIIKPFMDHLLKHFYINYPDFNYLTIFHSKLILINLNVLFYYNNFK